MAFRFLMAVLALGASARSFAFECESLVETTGTGCKYTISQRAGIFKVRRSDCFNSSLNGDSQFKTGKVDHNAVSATVSSTNPGVWIKLSYDGWGQITYRPEAAGSAKNELEDVRIYCTDINF